MDKDFLEVCGIILLATFLVGIVIVACASTYEYQVCKARSGLSSEYQYKWVLWGGCLVKLPSGMWVDYGDAQFVELEKGR